MNEHMSNSQQDQSLVSHSDATGDGKQLAASNGSGGFSDPSITYINNEVLNKQSNPYIRMSNTVVDQAAGMMVQDVRGFLQGSEQMLMAGYGKAISYIVNPGTIVEGTEMSLALGAIMAELAMFASVINSTASQITSPPKQS